LAVEQGILGSQLKKSYDAETDETVKKELSEQLKNISTLVSANRSAIAKSNPTLFIGTLYLAMEEVKAIELEQNINKEEARKNQYLWMREHYWDNVTMSEDGLMLSPVFHNKLKDYFDNYMIPVPDSAIAMADVLINRIEKGGSKEQYKYTIHYLLRYFEESKYMCMDKALWHMAKNYYCAGKAFWADSAYVAKMCEESNKMEPTLCDVLAPEMSMPDTTFTKRISMQAIDKPVTVLVFWDINCGHCKKEMPIIKAMYDSMTNEHFEIYAVYTQGDWEGWKKRLAEEKYDFINVANAFGDDKFREYYNIRTTPQIFVLDKDKKIRFKKIGAHDIANTIQFLLEEQGVVEPEKKE
jgi:thiol-disulfide isomerase/thioredoxin